jgi:CheY-like chemotaxis protein
MANNVKLLLVEDNPMVLGLLQQALSPLATVTSAPDGADALMKAVDDPPDLVVSDYRMPGMDGRQLVEKLKSRPATANFSAVLMASKSDIAERLSQQDAADDYLEKPFFLKDATRRIKRMIDRIALEKMAKTAPSDGVVRGNLAQMNVIDLMQSLEMGRKSCKISLTHEGDRCEVFFVEGQVKHATYGDLVGDPAVFKVLRWTGGNFQLDFEGKTDKETTQLNTQGLLMEGLRLLDESQRDGGESEDATVADTVSSAAASGAESTGSGSSFSDPFASHPPGPPASAPTSAPSSSASSFSDPFAAHPPGPPAAAPASAAPAHANPAPAPPRKKEEEEDVLLDN